MVDRRLRDEEEHGSPNDGNSLRRMCFMRWSVVEEKGVLVCASVVL